MFAKKLWGLSSFLLVYRHLRHSGMEEFDLHAGPFLAHDSGENQIWSQTFAKRAQKKQLLVGAHNSTDFGMKQSP